MLQFDRNLNLKNDTVNFFLFCCFAVFYHFSFAGLSGNKSYRSSVNYADLQSWWLHE